MISASAFSVKKRRRKWKAKKELKAIKKLEEIKI